MKKEKTKNVASWIPKIARKMGENSVNAACVYWICQPKVPASMMKKEEKKD